MLNNALELLEIFSKFNKTIFAFFLHKKYCNRIKVN